MNRKTQIKTWWTIILFTFTFQHANAYTTLPDKYLEVEPGKSYSIEVPDVPVGWVDFTKWTCNNSYIIFQSKENFGAYIKIDKRFSGTAKIELLFVEKWYDDRGWTQQKTYIKNYILTSKSGGQSDGNENGDVEEEIAIPPTTIFVGESKILWKAKTKEEIFKKSEYETSGEIVGSTLFIEQTPQMILVYGKKVGKEVINYYRKNGDVVRVKLTVVPYTKNSEESDNDDSMSLTLKNIVKNLKKITNYFFNL